MWVLPDDHRLPEHVPDAPRGEVPLRAQIAGASLAARILQRTLRQAGVVAEVGAGGTPLEVSAAGYPDAFLVTDDPQTDALASVAAWSRRDGVAVVAFGAFELPARLALFDAGADDVWAVDLRPEEAVARLHAILRRMGRESRIELTDGAYHLAITRNDLMVDGRSIRMTRIRHHLLFILAENHPGTTRHDELIEQVWGYQVIGGDEPGFIQTQVSRLRRELAQAGLGELVRTARGVGYGISPRFSRPRDARGAA